MNRKLVKEVYDDYIVDICDWKKFYKDNFVYKIITKSGDAYYYNESGQLHRLDGPAFEFANGYKQYYIEGKSYSYVDWCEKLKEYE